MTDSMIKTERKNGVMMFELVIIIGFFAILSVFIVKIFVAANTDRNNAECLSKALLVSKSSVEYLKAQVPGDFDVIFDDGGFNKISANEYVKYFDAGFNEASSKMDKGFTLKITLETVRHNKGMMYVISSMFTANKDDSELYSYSDSIYKQEGIK